MIYIICYLYLLLSIIFNDFELVLRIMIFLGLCMMFGGRMLYVIILFVVKIVVFKLWIILGLFLKYVENENW